MIVIIDYGVGNLRSIKTKLDLVKVEATITSEPSAIKAANKLILPGVGHFGYGMSQLRHLDLIGPLEDSVLGREIPILGICLGMQLFSKGSEEGDQSGLGWIDGIVRKFRFPSNHNLPIPHMGWNSIQLKKPNPIMDHTMAAKDFYFANSYHWDTISPEHVLGVTHYGYDFPSLISKDNIYGTQFHPEKSHLNGLQVIKNFAENL